MQKSRGQSGPAVLSWEMLVRGIKKRERLVGYRGRSCKIS